jgi:two-component system response regulator YesN
MSRVMSRTTDDRQGKNYSRRVPQQEVVGKVAANQSNSNILQGSGAGSVILIADKAFHEFYRSLNTKAVPFVICTPKDAREVLEQNRADIILVDCGFDVLGGLKLLRTIKATHASTPVIFLTERPINAVREAYNSGARRVFEKPFDLRDLRSTIETLLTVKKTSNSERRNAILSSSGAEMELPASTLTTDKPTPVVRAIQYIENNLSEKFSLDTLAREANMSKYHFCRLFSQSMGLTPIQFAAFFRIERAKELLKRGDLTISAIALQVGFNDLGPFLRQFKKITGLTPSAYKKAMRATHRKRA